MADSNFEKLYYPEIDVEFVRVNSSIWLARDHRLSRYVALKIVIAGKSQESREGGILCLLAKGDPNCVGRQFNPPLLDEFFFDGPNGKHLCLVQEAAGYNVAASKENGSSCMFPRDAARSIAAQLIIGLCYLHKNDICHGDLYPFLLRMEDPEIIITDYGTSFVAFQTSSPTLQTPDLYAPPEALFEEPIMIPTAADIWTLGVSLYEVLGRRRLFEAFAWCPDDMIGEMVDTLGQLPSKWWDSCEARSESLNQNGAWSLHQRMWTMGRGKTPESCEWDVSTMSFEPEKRPTVKQLLESEYMVKWTLPAWERQKQRKMEKERKFVQGLAWSGLCTQFPP
ncbi:kinase domain-containing protein [Aspergillus venezuelensis]